MKVKHNQKHLEALKYLKKYKKRAYFESSKTFLFNHLLKFIFIFLLGLLMVFVLYKIIKWQNLFLDYKNKEGIFSINNNTESNINNSFNAYKDSNLNDVVLPTILYKENATNLEQSSKEDYEYRIYILKTLISFLEKQSIKIIQINIYNYNDFEILTSNNLKLKFNFDKDLENTINNIYFVYLDEITRDILLNKHKDVDYIDFRFADRVYFKNIGLNINNQNIASSTEILKIIDQDIIIPR